MQSLCKDLGTCHIVTLVAKTCEQDLLVITPCLSLHVCFGVYGVMGISLLRSSEQPLSTHTHTQPGGEAVEEVSLLKLGESTQVIKGKLFLSQSQLESKQRCC